MTLQMFSF